MLLHSIRFIALAAALFFAAAPAAYSCGMRWSEPKSHFDGVDYQGYAYLIETLGELDLGEDLKLPIYALFNSRWNSPSPYLGYGWQLPLLEAHMIQVDDRFFKMVQPDGWFRLFWRDKENPNILIGQSNWRAEIKGDTITAWADCGDKLVFSEGRIKEMQLDDRTFTYVYSGDRVIELREGGKTVLRVEAEPGENVASAFVFSGKRVELEHGERPIVQNIGGQKVIGEMAKALEKIIKPDENKSFEYGVDEQMNPTLKMNERLIVWKAETGHILRSEDWTYSIKPGDSILSNAAIHRTNNDKESEYWFDNEQKGIETTRHIDGSVTTTYRFTSGPLAGALRKIIVAESKEATGRTAYQASYSAEGTLAREQRGDVIKYYSKTSPNTVERISIRGQDVYSNRKIK